MPHNRVKRYLFVQCTCCLICLYWKLYGFEISKQKLVKQFIAWWWNNLATQPFHIGSTTHFESIIIIFIMNNILVKKEWENNAFTVLIIELYSQHSFILIKFSFFGGNSGGVKHVEQRIYVNLWKNNVQANF